MARTKGAYAEARKAKEAEARRLLGLSQTVREVALKLGMPKSTVGRIKQAMEEESDVV